MKLELCEPQLSYRKRGPHIVSSLPGDQKRIVLLLTENYRMYEAQIEDMYNSWLNQFLIPYIIYIYIIIYIYVWYLTSVACLAESQFHSQTLVFALWNFGKSVFNAYLEWASSLYEKSRVFSSVDHHASSMFMGHLDHFANSSSYCSLKYIHQFYGPFQYVYPNTDWEGTWPSKSYPIRTS